MDWFGWSIFVLIVIVGVIIEIKRSKNKAATISVIIIVLIVYFIYFVIGHLFKTDILNAITFRINGGISISFIGIILLVGTTLLVTYVLYKYKRR